MRGAEQAAGMARDTVRNSLGDRVQATHEDREHRKRRLVKGPSEFREMRQKQGDAPRKKRSDRRLICPTATLRPDHASPENHFP